MRTPRGGFWLELFGSTIDNRFLPCFAEQSGTVGLADADTPRHGRVTFDVGQFLFRSSQTRASRTPLGPHLEA